MKELLPVSVVVTTRNSGDHLEDCLRSVVENSPSELIIVDGNSNDDTLVVAKRFTTRIFNDNGGGISRARYIGSIMAKEKFVAFVDSDILLPPDGLAVMIREIQSSNCSAIMSPCFKISGVSTYWSTADVRHVMCSRLFVNETRLTTFCTLFRREILLQFGFDLSYGGCMDDKDLGMRLIRDGRDICYSQIVPIHMKKLDFSSFANYSVHLGRTKAAYFMKYGFTELRNFPLIEGIFWSLNSIVHGLSDMLPFFLVRSFFETIGFLRGPPGIDAMRRRHS